jgi:phosphohistidine phosphatase SixA
MKLLVLLLATLLAAVPLVSRQEAAPALPVVVFLLRHAEALPSSAAERDPALAEAGEARARTLARLLGAAGVTHLFASEYARTQATLAPLAAETGLAVAVVPASAAERQIAELRALPAGSVAVVAGHSNTVPGLARALAGETMRALVDEPGHGLVLPHEAHDRIAQVILPADPEAGAATRMIELRYGD